MYRIHVSPGEYMQNMGGAERHNLHSHQHTPEHDVALRDTLYRRRPRPVTFNHK